MDELELELKQGFLEEAAQLLADTEQCFMDLEKPGDRTSLLEKIFRLAHNLKGSAKAVGFNQMGEFTHQLESLLLKLKKGELEIRDSTVGLLLECNDHLRKWVDLLKTDLNALVDSQKLLSSIADQLEGNAGANSFSKIETIVTESLTTESLTMDEVKLVEAVLEPEAIVETWEPAPVVTTAPASDETIRVGLKRLERLMNNVGELVILQTVLNQQRMQIESKLVQKTIQQLAKITKDIQDISMSLRMVPLKQTFQKMQRIVRDSSKLLSKEINFVMSGEETELDKTVVDHLGDPLVHLIRNAVDHGIESAEERIAAGKNPNGSVRLSAFHQGSQLIIEIQDDGKGLDPQKLIAKAIEKGILKPGQKLSDRDAHHLIFAPGFSTKAEVTEISGRGVGMDVVKTNIEKVLKGEVQLTTTLGSGTCFRITLPLTLAIIDGMVVKAAGERYVVPLGQVHESVQPKPQDVNQVTGMGEVLNLRGESLPLVRLQTVLGRAAGQPKNASEGIAIIVRQEKRAFAVWVEDIIGQQQVVIKRLGSEIQHLKGISGGAILGDGRAALILDFNELGGKAS